MSCCQWLLLLLSGGNHWWCLHGGQWYSCAQWFCTCLRDCQHVLGHPQCSTHLQNTTSPRPPTGGAHWDPFRTSCGRQESHNASYLVAAAFLENHLVGTRCTIWGWECRLLNHPPFSPLEDWAPGSREVDGIIGVSRWFLTLPKTMKRQPAWGSLYKAYSLCIASYLHSSFRLGNNP